MQKQISAIRQVDFGANRAGPQLAQEFVTRQRAKAVPQAAIVNNFDPDQRGFLTSAMQGLVMLQDQFGSRLAAHLDYGVIPPGQNKALRMMPGTPVLVYPAPAVSPAMNTTFVRGGKINEKRAYPVKYLTAAQVTYIFGDTNDQGLYIVYSPRNCVSQHFELYFDQTGTAGWDENSPLPPGMRYMEEQEQQWGLLNQFGYFPPGTRVDGESAPDIFAFIPGLPPDIHDQILPHDSAGNIRHNIKPLPDRAWSHLGEVFSDDSYWTGEVPDPVSWLGIDHFWQEAGITRENLENWLNVHPKARFNRTDA